MKHAVRFVVSLLAAGGLLGSVASHATDLAELPLKSSVLAKPNVIFGLDDSGSMDSELMMYNNDGAYWWDFDNASGWGIDAAHPNASLRTITSSWFNNAGTASSRWRKMVYLFPNGTGTGDRQYADASNDHFAILPTTQFATLRWSGIYYDSTTSSYKSAPSDPAQSSMHNPIYYNTLVTYKPWAPAQLSTGAVTPTAASTTAAKAHPMRGTYTFNLTANIAANPTDQYVFTAFPGVKVPAGSQKKVCNSDNSSGCSGWTAVAADENAATSKVTRVAMTYYPATFWVKESCTVPSTVSVGTDDCTYLPGSTTVTLKRYEIKSTTSSYPSGRSYTDEMQNFANWFQYYRKRRLMLAGAMGQTMENLTGMRLGVVPFAANATATMYDADSTTASNNRLRVAGLFYEVANGSGTPTRITLKYIGDQFMRTDRVGGGSTGAFNVVQYACQRNNAFIVTDGFANNDTVTPPGWDTGKSASNWGAGAPYAADFTHNGTLADLALRYYTNNIRSDLTAGKLPSTATDTNNDLHMNTYGLTLGARGTLFLGESSTPPTTTSAWPDPNTDRNPTSVDDLWRATLNGRGKLYLATTPEETALRVRAGLDDILSARGAQSGVAVSTVNLSRGDGFAYMGTYNPSGWSGDLTANTIDSSTGAISTTATWSAGTILNARSWGSRVIASATASGGVAFTETGVGTLVNPSNTWGTTSQVMDYLRGDRSLESTVFRRRTSLIGAVLNAEPVISRDDNIVYVASGEGMLHAIDIAAGTDRGKELWAFVPRAVLPDIGKTTARAYTFKTQLDGTPTVAKSGASSKLLVAGMGAAGNGYYAIDVTSPRSLTEAGLIAAYKWEFPTAGDATTQAKVGQTVGKPVIVKTADDGYVVLVTSGYNSTADGLGRLWMLNVSDGTVIKEFVTSEGSISAEAGLAHISPYADDDGNVQFAYGGDLLGNVWRFDLKAKTAPTKLAVLKSASGARQPVTAAPELAYLSSQRVVIVGTGRLLDITDFGATATQSLYAIAADGTATMDPARDSLVQQVYTRSTNTITSNSGDWTTKHGWYVDLPTGEQANTHPVLAYGGVSFVTNKTGSTDCSASSYLYVLDVTSGSKSSTVTDVMQPLWTDANATGLTAVLTESGDIRGEVRSYDGALKSPQLAPKPVIDPKKNSWREVRKE